MASTSTISDRSELLFLGKECHHPACHLNDFLPFECPACHASFCQPHFLPSQHSCKSPLPPSMQDRIAPQCPLCNEVVPTPRGGGDPNEAVERHISSGGCLGLEGGELKRKAEAKRRKDVGEVCWRKGCSKVLVVQMKCDSCSHAFCPPHRHPKDHHCTSPPSSGTSTPISSNKPRSGFSKLIPPSMQTPSSSSSRPGVVAGVSNPPRPLAGGAPIKSHSGIQGQNGGIGGVVEVRAAAAAAAMKRAGQDVNVPFVKSKTDKRADAEIQSAIKALKARHDKGLLSKQEEVRYAELLAKNHSGRLRSGSGRTRDGKEGKEGKDGCVVC